MILGTVLLPLSYTVALEVAPERPKNLIDSSFRWGHHPPAFCYQTVLRGHSENGSRDRPAAPDPDVVCEAGALDHRVDGGANDQHG
jgi:hypothetical protein